MQRSQININTNTNTNMKNIKSTIAQLSIVNGVNAPFVSKCVEYAQLSSKREVLGETLKAEFAAILSSTGVKEAVAAKQLAASLATALEGVVKSPAKRASEILCALGIRQRAEKAKDEESDELSKELAPVIEALKALAKEKAADKAVNALRRAYLSLQGENKAE
jgi:hypothetical protein